MKIQASPADCDFQEASVLQKMVEDGRDPYRASEAGEIPAFSIYFSFVITFSFEAKERYFFMSET